MQGVKSLLFKSFWLVFNLLTGASGGAMLPLSSTQRCLKKNSKSSLVKKHTLHWLRSPEAPAIFHSAITAEETGTEHLGKWHAQWHRKFAEFQISGKSDNLERLTKIFEMNFAKISVPFDSVPEFPELLVEWKAPLDSTFPPFKK